MKPLSERIESMLAELRVIAKAEGVTDGPWRVSKSRGSCSKNWSMDSGDFTVFDCTYMDYEGGGDPPSDADAAFIARSRTITPAMAEMLIEAIEGLADAMHALRIPLDAPGYAADATIKLTEICDRWEKTKL